MEVRDYSREGTRALVSQPQGPKGANLEDRLGSPLVTVVTHLIRFPHLSWRTSAPTLPYLSNRCSGALERQAVRHKDLAL